MKCPMDPNTTGLANFQIKKGEMHWPIRKYRQTVNIGLHMDA